MSAFDNLIAAALDSGDDKLKQLARLAMDEVYREPRRPGRPPKLTAENSLAMFIVFNGLHARHYTGEVNFVDDEPLAVTTPSIDSTNAIAQELANTFGVSINTARDFARVQIRLIVARLRDETGTTTNSTGCGKFNPKELATLKSRRRA